MLNIKKNTFLLFALLVGIAGMAQTIKENKFYSNYKYLLKLDSAQLRFLNQKNKLDTAWLFNSIVDSFYKDSSYNYSKLGFGTYLICYVQEHQIYFNTYHKNPFMLDVWGVNTKNFVIVKDHQGKVIENAKISLPNGKNCQYSIGMASYELPKITNGTIVKVEYQGYFDYMVVNPSYYNAPRFRNSYPQNRSNKILPGYIALNQPKYKKLDTVKFKVFLVYNDGVYYNEKITLWIVDDNGREKKIGAYKSKTSGAYFGQFALSDTLISDREYNLIFRNNLNEEIKRTRFTIENYVLKQNTYDLSMTSNIIYPGQKIIAVAKARDANNLPIMDGYVKFNIRLSSISQVNTNMFFVPNTWYQSMLTMEKELDPSGYTSIEISDTLFRNFNGAITVDATFTNEENELITRSVSFNYENKNHTYAITAQKDSIAVNYYFQAHQAIKELRLVTFFTNEIRRTTLITTPYIEKLDYAAVRYELYQNDTLVASYYCPEIDQWLGVYGKRSFDSISIKLYNPLLIPVHYEIYKDTKKVAEGKSSIINFSAGDATSSSYYIFWGHNYRGGLRNNFKTQSFHFQEKKLYVDLTQPEEIYPGQSVKVNIKVTDAYNKPVENVNLTAYSINTQFGEIPLPDLPYMGLIRNDEPLHFTSPYFQLFNCNTSQQLKPFQIDALHLERNEMYRLIYSKDQKTILKFKTKNKLPELAIYLFSQHQLQPVVSIIIDNQILYHSRNTYSQQYTFPVSSGSHNLKIRSNSLLFNLGEFNFEDSTKYIFGIQLDNIKGMDTTKMVNGGFDKKEYLDYIGQSLFIHIDEGFDTIQIYQGGKLCFFGNHNSTYKTISIDQDLFYAITLIERGDIKIKLNGRYEHEIVFEPNKVYYMNKTEVKSFPMSAKGKAALSYFDNSYNNKYNLTSFDQTNIDPEIIILDTFKKDDPKEKQKNIRQRPFIYYRNYAPAYNNVRNALAVYQKHDYVPYKRAWLINRKDESKSVIQAYEGYISYVDSGYYDLILLNDTAMCITKNIYLPYNGTLHLFLFANVVQELDQIATWDYEQIVKRLTKIPLRLYTDTPITIRPKLMKTITWNNNYGKLSGNVEDAIFHTPLDMVTIIAEIDGKYHGGALTNADGDFEINYLPEGNYMLKLRVDGYHYQIAYDLKVENGMEKVLKLRLLHLEDSVTLDKNGVAIYKDRNRYDEKRNNEKASSAIRYSISEADNISPSSPGYYSIENTPNLMGYSAGTYSMNGQLESVEVTVAGNFLNDGVLETSVPITKINEEKMQQHLNDLSQDVAANRVRNTFRDYGYWVPNLLTNRQGIASINVQFPDNITSWKTIIPAMNGSRQSGLTTMITKSYKPLMATYAAPQFLIAGDYVKLKGRIINYTGIIQNASITFSVNQKTRKQYEAALDKVTTDTLMIKVGSAYDTLTTAFTLKLNNGYTDGEERLIPIKPNAISISKSEYISLIKDTMVQYIVPEEVRKAHVYVYNTEIDQLKHEINELKNYSYGCTEQTTSKLRAMLAEKNIAATLKLSFTGDKEIKQLIKRLEVLKNNKGTWGWWENAYEDYWLTMYVIKTLNEARLAGYSNNIYIRAANRMQDELPIMNIANQLEALNLLKDLDRRIPYDTFTRRMDYSVLDIHQKLLYLRLMQRIHPQFDVSDIITYSHILPNGALSWGGERFNYKYDDASNTLLAFDILSNDSAGRSFLPNIKSYFNSDAFTRHTLARAEIITLYLRDWNQHHAKNKNIFGDVIVNGNKLAIKDYPFIKTYSKKDTISIEHQGNESYVNIISDRLESKPQPNDSFFRISTYINQKKDSISLKTGTINTLEIQIEVIRSAQNVMLEIPIPAGFTYYNKGQGKSQIETHREYDLDKTSIFCSNMPRGKYSFYVQMVPKFSGVFNLPPAKVELMYYPEIRNNEIPKVVVVE